MADIALVPSYVNTIGLYVVSASFLGAMFLPVQYGIVLQLFIISNGFDLLPREIYGIKLYDVGVLLFPMVFISYVLFRRTGSFVLRNPSAIMRSLYAYVAVMFISLVWSFVFYNYPAISIVQSSRTVIPGYIFIFGLLYMFNTDQKCFQKVHELLFKITLLLVCAHIVQFFSGSILFFGYNRIHDGQIRSIPIYIPLMFIYLYSSVCSYLVARKLSFVKMFYVTACLVSFALMWTRGIYIAIAFGFAWMAIVLVRHGSIKLSRAMSSVFIVAICVMIIFSTGFVGEKLVNRIVDAADSIAELQSKSKHKLSENTFSLRLRLLDERLAMVANKNFLIGYGFIHDNIANRTLSYKVGTYNSLAFRESTFLTADIAWADIVIYTGFLGLSVFVVMILIVVFGFLSRSNAPLDRSDDSILLYSMRCGYYSTLATTFLLMLDGSHWVYNMGCHTLVMSGYIHLSALKIKQR